MQYGAIHLNLHRSHVRIVDERDHLILDQYVDTAREAFTQLFAHRRRIRILLEHSVDSEWVAQHLEALGHEVIVVDSTHPTLFSRTRRVRTNKRDVTALANANRRGIYSPVRRASVTKRELRQRSRVRRQLMQQRTTLMNLLRVLLREEGVRVAPGGPESVTSVVDQLAVPEGLQTTLAPVRAILTAFDAVLEPVHLEGEGRPVKEASGSEMAHASG